MKFKNEQTTTTKSRKEHVCFCVQDNDGLGWVGAEVLSWLPNRRKRRHIKEERDKTKAKP
jgi:hypothetical protein